MANVLTHIKRTQYERFVKRIGMGVQDYARVSRVRFDDTNTLKMFDVTGGGTWSSQHATNDPSSTDLSSSSSSKTYSTYERLYKAKWDDVLDNQELRNELTDKLADEALATISNVYWTTFKALDTTAHPEDGNNYTEAGAGTVYFADVFATPVAQQNLLTAALSSTSLATARKTLRKYKNKAGLNAYLDVSNQNLCLVVPAELEQLALSITTRDGEIFDGAGLQMGGFRGMDVVVSPEMTDANDWALVHKPSSPVELWIRQRPQLEIENSRYPGRWSWYGQLSTAVCLKPWEGGVIFSKVA